MKHVDLFSGIGGFALATDWAFEKVEHIFCEIDPFCQKILKKHWPNSKIHDDIKTFTASDLGRVDLLTGGFPCQPFSVAGEQRAQDDDRHLWPEMFRIIKECRPSWVVGENVTGIIELALEEVCLDLESEGYEVWPIIIPACAVNAPHRRDRVWIVAHRDSERGDDWLHSGQERQIEASKVGRISPDKSERQGFKFELGKVDSSRVTSNPCSQRPQRRQKNTKRRQREECQKQFERFCDNNNWQNLPQPGVSRGDDGFSQRVDRVKSLGNAIVPQVAYEIIKHIAQ